LLTVFRVATIIMSIKLVIDVKRNSSKKHIRKSVLYANFFILA